MAKYGLIYHPCDNGIHICVARHGDFVSEYNKELNPVEARIVFETIKQEFKWDFNTNSRKDWNTNGAIIDLMVDGVNVSDFGIKEKHIQRIQNLIEEICNKNYQEA